MHRLTGNETLAILQKITIFIYYKQCIALQDCTILQISNVYNADTRRLYIPPDSSDGVGIQNV